MAVEILRQSASAAPHPHQCSSSYKTKNSVNQYSKFSKIFSKTALTNSRNNSGKAKPIEAPTQTHTLATQLSSSCELQRLFCYFDRNGDGKISPSELINCMQTTGEELSSEEAAEAIRLSDFDGDGELGLEDFVKLVNCEDEQEKDKNLMDAFRMYEMEGRGYITAKSLQRTLRRLGEDPTVENCTAMIGQFDLNRDGVLSFEEFKVMMQ